MSHQKKGFKYTGTSKETIASLQKSIASMKMINKELVLNMQKLKKEVSSSASQNCNLKAELYDMIMEKNSLMEKNIKLVELLRSLQEESSSVGKRIDDLLGPRDSDRSRLSPKQSAVICPMVSGHVIHNPKVELRRLNFNDYPNIVYVPGNDAAVTLSPVIEQQYEEPVQRRFGHRLQLPQNISNIRNRKVAEESFYSVGSWTVENRNLEASGQSNSSNNSSESNSSPSASNEILAQPGSSQIDVKPSGSRLLADENTNSSETDRTLNEGSLLTINVMSPKNDPQSSSILLNPSVFLNVCPRKRKYATELSSNNGFSASEVKEETNDENQESNYSNINNLKYPIVVSERLPALFTETLTINAGGNVPPKEPQLNSSKDGKTEIRKRSKPSLRSRSTRSADGSSKHTKNDSFDNRRSVRSRKAISYKE
ncbi:putative uncharacterized protein DDB_G0285119 [Halyomorpha halys]|uniref:putative uncharacterized protein DDB_G0285119 n=1 Tax=Halyomorpha halys TaxID=286706 RepID=UPI0006D4DDB8|nr:uncharacterized protein LOC106687844 [Halyomorpha halys]